MVRPTSPAHAPRLTIYRTEHFRPLAPNPSTSPSAEVRDLGPRRAISDDLALSRAISGPRRVISGRCSGVLTSASASRRPRAMLTARVSLRRHRRRRRRHHPKSVIGAPPSRLLIPVFEKLPRITDTVLCVTLCLVCRRCCSVFFALVRVALHKHLSRHLSERCSDTQRFCGDEPGGETWNCDLRVCVRDMSHDHLLVTHTPASWSVTLYALGLSLGVA